MNKCVLPFINFDYQTNNPCCQLKNYDHNKDLDLLLQDHNNNIKSKFCTDCWQDEDIQVKSKRQIYNSLYNKHLKNTVRTIKTIIVPTGNVCNLYCVTCIPKFSTGWHKKYLAMTNKQPIDKDIIQNVELDHVKNLDNVEHIEFIGGETLLSKSLWTFLQQLDKNVSFSLQTNGTVLLNDQQINLLNSFKNFNICFSFDGYNKIFEYLRQPAQWDNAVKNIINYKNYFGLDRLSFYITVSNLNIYYIDKIVLNLFKMLPCKIDLNLIHSEQFAYNNLPYNVGKQIQKLNPVFFKNRSVEWIGDKNSIEKLINDLINQEKFSKRKFKDYLPELHNILGL